MSRENSQAVRYHEITAPTCVVVTMGPRQVCGRLLGKGDAVQPGDVYESTAGVWAPAPCPGVELTEDPATRFVRPCDPPAVGSGEINA